MLPQPPLTPSERNALNRAAVLSSWAHTPDRSARTARARATFNQRFEDEVDPDRVLDPAERARRAEQARRAYFTKLAVKSARARRRKAAPDAA